MNTAVHLKTLHEMLIKDAQCKRLIMIKCAKCIPTINLYSIKKYRFSKSVPDWMVRFDAFQNFRRGWAQIYTNAPQKVLWIVKGLQFGNK